MKIHKRLSTPLMMNHVGQFNGAKAEEAALGERYSLGNYVSDGWLKGNYKAFLIDSMSVEIPEIVEDASLKQSGKGKWTKR